MENRRTDDGELSTRDLLEQLKAAFSSIASDDQQWLFRNDITMTDVESELRNLKGSLGRACGTTRAEKWVSQVSDVMDQLALIVNPLTNQVPLAAIVWGAIKTLVQVSSYFHTYILVNCTELRI